MRHYISAEEFDLMTEKELDAIYGTDDYKNKLRLEDELLDAYLKNYENGKGNNTAGGNTAGKSKQ